MLKLNCDLGELTGDANNDASIMPFIDQANIACGFHASTPLIMQQTVALAVQHNVTIGAHPSYPDKENFGRLSLEMSDEDLIATIQYQIGAPVMILDFYTLASYSPSEWMGLIILRIGMAI